MKIISHRGNLNGKDKLRENKPWAIYDCIALGFDVEVDLWVQDSQFYLGHDEPETKIEYSFLKKNAPYLWIHAKNFKAVEFLSLYSVADNLHWFWHEHDRMTLTSKGIPWCYPNNCLLTGITVLLDQKTITEKVYGVCTDFPQKLNK